MSHKTYKETEIPFIPDNLLTYLNEHYPEKCPDRSMPEREIWIYAGKRELVKNLNMHKEKQNNSSYELKFQ